MRNEQPAKFREIYQMLFGYGIEVILVGGGAANLLGSARFTLDVDVVYRRETENMRKIVARDHRRARSDSSGSREAKGERQSEPQ